MEKYKGLALFVLVLVGILFLMAPPYFVLEEGEVAVVKRMGQIVKTEKDAGLKFKLPFIEDVVRYPKKIQSWDGNAQRLPTEENQFILVDTTARWQITDVKLFYSRLKTINEAQSRLDDIIDSSVRKIIARNLLREAIRNSNIINEIKRKNVFQSGSEAKTGKTSSEESKEDAKKDTAEAKKSIISSTYTNVIYDTIAEGKGRKKLSDDMLTEARGNMAEFGITLIDIIIRQIKYSDDLTQSVYNRMIKERNQIAQAFRSDGEGERAKWLGKMEKELRTIRSGAERDAKEIKAKADGEALEIRNKAYNKDAEFAEFWMALVQYQKILPNMKKILTTDLEFFKYLYKKSGNR
ncbi:MAG: protease modulator HflC [bacterium]|nr:protease modulator HflC [bacterium]